MVFLGGIAMRKQIHSKLTSVHKNCYTVKLNIDHRHYVKEDI